MKESNLVSLLVTERLAYTRQLDLTVVRASGAAGRMILQLKQLPESREQDVSPMWAELASPLGKPTIDHGVT